MEYLGKDIPKLGFGLMRLPMLGEEVDLEQTKQMVDKFLEAGFTYFDTAYGYLGGKSEEAVKTALVDRYPRESFQLATKLPAWAGAQTAGEAKEMLQTSLRRTGAGYFDFYLLHNCGDDRTQAFDKFGIWDYALEMKEKGLLKHVGFSFHDKADVLDELLTKHRRWSSSSCKSTTRTGRTTTSSPAGATRWPASTTSRLSSWSLSRAACWPIPPRRWPRC